MCVWRGVGRHEGALLSPRMSADTLLSIFLPGQVRAVVNKEMAGPQEHVKKYDKYSHLVTKKAEADVERFLLEGHDFDRFAVVCCIAVSVVLTSSSAFLDFFYLFIFSFAGSGQVCRVN